MTIRNPNFWLFALCGMTAISVACGDVEDDTMPPTEDGTQKAVDSKSDAWNYRNDPAHFRTELNYRFEDLPLEGYSNRVAWPGSYWPYYQDGINHRWLGNNTLSPAEKYDMVYNNWSHNEEFMSLKPYNHLTCEWDDAYYSALGPAATWTHRNRGNWISRNGVDDDRDGIDDRDECGSGENQDRDGVETWFGICHAWAPAAFMEDEPLRAVERDGVRFEVSDIKALLMQQYDRVNAYMVGGRCNDRELERDENGRIVNEECRDLNAGSFHVIISNFLGMNERPFVIERTTNYEVWNQPLVGYKVTSSREIDVVEAHRLLGVQPGQTEGTGIFVHGVEEGSAEATAILRLVNTGTFQQLDVDARLDKRAVRRIMEVRPLSSLARLNGVPYVNAPQFASLLSTARAMGLYEEVRIDFMYNNRAERFIEVQTTTDWITESHAMTTPTTPIVSRYTRHDHYHYILELDGEGNIIGGEWVGASKLNHPDFVWLPTRAVSGNPHISLETVREMVRESRGEVNDGTGFKSFTNRNRTAIPDNDPQGITSRLEVSEDGAIREITIDLEIEHTYRGDLIVELKKDNVSVVVFDGTRLPNGWEDNVSLTSEVLDGFLGAPMRGNWELTVRDTARADIGHLVSWGINILAN